VDSGAKSIYQQLNKFIEQGQPVATATIVQVRGSAPRQVGSKMLIHPDGRHVGTIGGGAGEAAAIEAGLRVIKTGVPQTLTLDLTGSPGESDAQGVCGGLTHVFVDCWPAPDAIVPRLLAAMQSKKPVALATIIAAPDTLDVTAGQHALFVSGESPSTRLEIGRWVETLQADVDAALRAGQSKLLAYADGALSIFVETPQPPPTLLIVGAGHVAQPLAQLGAMLGFEVAVLDDRPGFASPERFPAAARTIQADFVEALRDWPLDANTFVVLVTRGHTFDADCLEILLPSPAPYIGMTWQ